MHSTSLGYFKRTISRRQYTCFRPCPEYSLNTRGFQRSWYLNSLFEISNMKTSVFVRRFMQNSYPSTFLISRFPLPRLAPSFHLPPIAGFAPFFPTRSKPPALGQISVKIYLTLRTSIVRSVTIPNSDVYTSIHL